MQKSQNPYELTIAEDMIEVWNIIQKKELSTKDISLMIGYVLDKLATDAIPLYIAYLASLGVVE